MAYGRSSRYSNRSSKKMGGRMYSGMRTSRASGPRRLGSYRSSSRMQRFTPRFATVGFNRDVEKKYNDRALSANAPQVSTTGAGTAANQAQQGITWTSNTTMAYSNGGTAQGFAAKGDLLKGLNTGTTVETRIGNKIRAKYLKGAITFNCATVTNSTTSSNSAQNGESIVEVDTATELVQYTRTTFRWCIVKDLQVNSTDVNVKWSDVFESFEQDGPSGYEISNGVHAELNINNMGRYIILRDEYFDIDAKCPQKTIPYYIKGSEIGEVRYNGPTADAYTDKGIHIIWAAFTNGVLTSAAGKVGLVGPIWHSRLCFIDA